MSFNPWDAVKVAVGVVLPPVGVALAADAALNNGDAYKTMTGQETSGQPNVFEDQMAAGQTNFTPQTYNPDYLDYGRTQNGAADMSQYGINAANAANRGMGWADAQARLGRDPQAPENQQLSDLEAQTRGGDQAGALQLSRENAMGVSQPMQLLQNAAQGQSPSEAAYLMQSGLNTSLAQQQAIAGGARGAGGIALAGQNMAANNASLNNQAFTQAGALRANEMAAARGAYSGAMNQATDQYGNLSSTVRNQDLTRLAQADQVGQFNSTNNDAYKVAMGGLANNYGQTGAQYYGLAQKPMESQLQGDTAYQNIAADSFNKAQGLAAGINTSNAQEAGKRSDKAVDFTGTLISTGGKIAAGAA